MTVDGVQLLLVMIGAVAVTALTRGFPALQPGLVVVVVAGAVSFLPFVPHLQLPPGLILSVVLPPLVYSAAQRVSFFAFVRNLRPMVGLGVGLVAVTAGAVVLVSRATIPLLSVPAAFCLAAVVSPPDAVGPASHGRELGLPRRVTAILTGESLVNDATALVIFTSAVTVLAGQDAFIRNPFLLFGYAAAVGIGIGLVLGIATTWIRSVIGSPSLETAISLLLPFAAYLAAEQAHASGVLAVVMAGFSVSVNSTYAERGHASRNAHLTRLQERDLWPIVDTLLEAFVFAYIGLQLHSVVDGLRASGPVGPTLLGAVAVLGVVVAVRLLYVYLLFAHYRAEAQKSTGGPDRGARRDRLDRWRERRARKAAAAYRHLSPKERVLVGWAGTRGIVTLAAAAGIPLATAGGEPIPGRTAIQVTAFVVAIATLLVQGGTLPLLVRTFHVDTSEEDGEAEAAEALAAEIVAGRTGYDEQRRALAEAVARGELEDEAAQEAIHRIDLAQVQSDIG